jgi:dihydroorotate dehydrogenase electron transfer subunit
MQAGIIKARRFGPYARLVLKAPQIAQRARPGQFVEILISGKAAPFWRRPFSICRVEKTTLELLIKVVGPGSNLLANMRSGEFVDIIGPLGRGFTLRGRGGMLLVGGGFGAAPLLFLAERLRACGRQVEVLIGGHSREDLLLRSSIKLTGASVACATEDGSYGKQGKVTDLLIERLPGRKPGWTLAASGPRPMLAAVAGIAARHEIHAEVCLEKVMACGMGICQGCVIKVGGAYQRVCKEGPVFSAQAVDWNNV